MRFLAAAAALLLGTISSVDSFSPPHFSTIAQSKKSDTSSSNPLTKEDLRKNIKQIEQDLRGRHDLDAWNALFVSAQERKDPVPITETEGELPADFPPGSLLRLGPNGAASTDGFFDGDGMVQCITFPPAESEEYKPSFSATYIETKGRKLEKESGYTKKFEGTLGGVPKGYPMIQSIFKNMLTFKTLQAQKDTCNTALAEHSGRVLALMEQCPPTEIEIQKDGRINTVESCSSLNGAIEALPISGGALSAHGRTCSITGERVHVSYRSDAKPYLRLDVFSSGWELKESVGIDIPTSIFSHDCALTKNYVVVFDLPLTLRTSKIFQNRFPVEYEPDQPARIGLVPRAGGETKWFDCDPGVLLHAGNAWESEDGKTVTIQGLWGEPSPYECYLEKFAPSFFYEYSINLETGSLTEQCLNSQIAVEFPQFNEELTGKECSSCYCIKVASLGGPLELFQQPKEGVIFDEVVKLAATTTETQQKGDVIGQYKVPDRWFCVSEPTVIPKKGKTGEYIALIASYVPEGITWQDVHKDPSIVKSKTMIFDGDDLDAGPVYTATLPHMVPYGLHSAFVGWDSVMK